MAKGKNTVKIVQDIIQPFADELNLSIWDIRFQKSGTAWYLTIFIDKEGGVSLDDCVALNHAINKPIDEADPIDQEYFLEVSSPGLERDLVKPEHFIAMQGENIKVRTIRPVDGERDFTGILENFEDGNITLKIDEEKSIIFTKKEASWIKLDDFDKAEEIEVE